MRLQSTTCLAVLALTASAPGAVATFDDLPEAIYSDVLVSGGITFYDVDTRGPGPSPGNIIIDDGSGTIPLINVWHDAYSPPNVLAMIALTQGPLYSPQPFAEIKMTTGSVATHAAVDLFHYSHPYLFGNRVVLEAYLSDALVGMDTLILPEDDPNFQFDQLSISGVSFDTLRLAGEGPIDQGRFLGGIDNVIITPEPATVSWLAVIAGCLCLRRCRATATR